MKKVSSKSIKIKSKPSLKETVEKYGGVYKEVEGNDDVTFDGKDIYVNGKLIGSKG